MKSVYIINGFLESGKTEFIKFTMQQQYFQINGKTLLLLCEEGENEYESDLLAATNTFVEVIEEKEELSASRLLELEKKYKPERVIIEYNGMWQASDLKLPWHWKVGQQITIINAQTFTMYMNNMRSLIGDMVKKSELIIFNRCDGIKDLATYKRSMMALNRNAEIVFEDSKGEVSATLDEELPFDVNQPVIELDDKTYGIWFFDMLDTPERYAGKKVKFLATIVRPDGFEDGYFVPGRKAMTCCAEDIAFLGFVAKWKEANRYQYGDWVMITAEPKVEYWADYQGEGPVLYATDVVPAKAPKEEILNLV